MFCLLSMKVTPGEEHSLVEKMMLADTQLWKGKKQNIFWETCNFKITLKICCERVQQGSVYMSETLDKTKLVLMFLF